MIKYDTKEWFTSVFKIHKADTIVKLKWPILYFGLYAVFIVIIEQYFFNFNDKSHISHIGTMHGILGFVISLLLVFRTNTAYERWWEGRKLWGALINTSRNLALKVNSIVDDVNAKNEIKILIIDYAYALKNHLRGKLIEEEFKFSSKFTKTSIHHNKHVPNQIAAVLFKEIETLHKNKSIDGNELLTMNNELSAFTDICGACERIKNTPIPFSYSVFLKKFIFIYVITLPIGYVSAMGYFVVPFTVFIFYVLASIELIGEEIEDPFGLDANDLPTDNICNNIKVSVQDIFEI